MIKFSIICEGLTEVVFVENVLADHLRDSIHFKPLNLRGGVSFDRLNNFVLQAFEDTNYVSTFIDFHKLNKKFPGFEKAKKEINLKKKLDILTQAMQERFVLVNKNFIDLNENQIDQRFIPYVQIHEFEGLLFSDIQALCGAIKNNKIKNDLEQIKKKFKTPEHIRNPNPGKCLTNLYPAYQKSEHGRLAATHIGLSRIMEECPLFKSWIYQLKALKPLTTETQNT